MFPRPTPQKCIRGKLKKNKPTQSLPSHLPNVTFLTGNCSYSLLTFLSQTGSPSCFLLRFVPGPLSKYSCAGGSKFSFHYSGFSLFLLNFFGLVVVFSFSLFLLNFSEQVAVLIFSLFLLNFSARQVAGDQHSWPWGGGSRRRGSLSGNYSLGEKQPSVILWESI